MVEICHEKKMKKMKKKNSYFERTTASTQGFCVPIIRIDLFFTSICSKPWYSNRNKF